MNAKEFLTKFPNEAPVVCKEAGTSMVYLRHLAAGHRFPSRELALRLEQASGGRMTRLKLLYPAETEAA